MRLPQQEQTHKQRKRGELGRSDSGSTQLGTGYNVTNGSLGSQRDSQNCTPATSIAKTVETSTSPAQGGRSFNSQLKDIFNAVVGSGQFNYRGARIPVPSGLKMGAWRHFLQDYHDDGVSDFLEFGWPVNYRGGTPLIATPVNHASAKQYMQDVDFYIKTEIGHRALAGPFQGPPVFGLHTSPLMTRAKRDAAHRRVIMDLSWPKGASVNDGVPGNDYIDGPAVIKLPTVDYMVARVLELGAGSYMYKTDMARGYRQLRVDPGDWPLLGFIHRGQYFMDICPPFGLKTSAMCMQRTSEAITYIHGRQGYFSRSYLDDFGGAEKNEEQAGQALGTLQRIMHELGVVEALHKVCQPAQIMVWLGILFNTRKMEICIPPAKLTEVMEVVASWQGRQRATRGEMQSLLGLLQFVASVSPPTRIYTNRMLQCLRDAPQRGYETLSSGFKRDLKFFADLLPAYNGIRVLQKGAVPCQQFLELDACLTGCGACTDKQFYSEEFPQQVLDADHTIAHLELLNVVVALKAWCEQWKGQRVHIACDNSNACLAVQTGRSRDPFMQHCAREIFLYTTSYDIQVQLVHQPGVQMVRADALSRAHTGQSYRDWIARDTLLSGAEQIRVPPEFFALTSDD